MWRQATANAHSAARPIICLTTIDRWASQGFNEASASCFSFLSIQRKLEAKLVVPVCRWMWNSICNFGKHLLASFLTAWEVTGAGKGVARCPRPLIKDNPPLRGVNPCWQVGRHPSTHIFLKNLRTVIPENAAYHWRTLTSGIGPYTPIPFKSPCDLARVRRSSEWGVCVG
jgi:hypothetical protein